MIQKSGLSTIKTYNTRLSRSASAQKSLCDLFDSGIDLDSTDPRDRVYALYGMAENSVLNDLSVSYSEPLASLAQRFSDYLITKGQAAYMFSHAGGPGKDCSSWSLDVNGNPETNSLFLGHSVKPNGTCATYSAGGLHSPSLRYGQNNTILLVSGFVSDGIASVTGPFPVPVFTDISEAMNVKTFWTAVERLDSILIWYSEKLPGQCDNFPLWRTIIADCNATVVDTRPHRRNRASEEFGGTFEELLQWKIRLQKFVEDHGIQSLTLSQMAAHLIPAKAALFWVSMLGTAMGRRLALTSSGTMALVPKSSVPSDSIAVFQGVGVSFVLRKEEDRYLLVGPCYHHGMMDGEAFELGLKQQDLELR